MSSQDRLRAASERIALLEAFGARLRALRSASGLSPGYLAEKCRLSASTISKAELGRYELRLSLIVILCDALGCSPSELMGDLPHDFRAYSAEFSDLGYRILGLSTQSVGELARWARRERISYLLASDEELRLAEALALPTRASAGRSINISC